MTRYNTLSPHPQVVKQWVQAGFIPSEDWLVDTQESVFLRGVGLGKVVPLKDPSEPDRKINYTESTEEKADRPITRTVHKIYRTKNNLFYHEMLEGRLYNGKEKTHGRDVGKYNEPHFSEDHNRETGQITITGFKQGKTVFEIPFTSGQFTDPSTGEKITVRDLPLAETCMFYVITPNRKYALAGITLDEFMDSTYDYLIEWGQTGRRPARKTEEPIIAKGKKNTLTVKAESE